MWDIALELDADAREPLFLQIARGIMEAIQEGRLQPGDRLVGSRTLASHLEVHRNTVLAAYNELAAQGWISQQEAKGTFVSSEIPDRSKPGDNPLPQGIAQELGYPLHPIAAKIPSRPALPPEMLVMAGGWPDLREVPMTELARAFRRALRYQGHNLLNYGDPAGHLALREALAQMMAVRRGIPARADDIVVTRGSQMGIALVAQALIRAGDIVAVEEFGYEPAWTALRMAGAHLEPLPIDQDGLQVDALEALLQRVPLRAIYLTPHHQFPTLAVLSAGRRMKLMELAQRHRFAIIEDDYDNEFHYEGRPVLPLASNDPYGVVAYIGTLSKVLAPGLRIGYVVAPRPLLRSLLAIRGNFDRQGNLAMEAAVAELFEEGLIQRHIRKMRKLYQNRRDTLIQALQTHLPDALTFSIPRGGLAIWARVDDAINADQWVEQAYKYNVLCHSGYNFFFDQRYQPFVRLGFARLQDGDIIEAVRRMTQALQTL